MEPLHRPQRQREVLSDDVAQQILTRAAELDAAQRAAIDVANLRAAAVEAGISPSAFDAALGEMQGGEQLPAASSRRRLPRVRTLVGVSAVVFLCAIAATRTLVPAPLPMSEEAFLLRCLPPGEAAELIRPLLGPTSTVAVSPTRAPRVLTIRSTPEQITRIGALLDARDGAACATPAAPR